MNFYNPHGHSAYSTQQPTNNGNNQHQHQHNHQSIDSLNQNQQLALQAALHAFDQPPAPSLREVLGAYRLKGDGDKEMLLAILNAKAAEDQRIASMAQLHQTILQVTHAHLTHNALANQLPPLVSAVSTGPGLGTGLGHSNHSHSHNSAGQPALSNSPPTRSQLMSISSLIGGGANGDDDGRSPRGGGSFSGSPSGSRSPASIGTSGSMHRMSSERSTS